VVFPCVSVLVVVPTPAWLFPGPSNVAHVTVPLSFVQLSGNGPAPTGTAANATATMSAKELSQSASCHFSDSGIRSPIHLAPNVVRGAMTDQLSYTVPHIFGAGELVPTSFLAEMRRR